MNVNCVLLWVVGCPGDLNLYVVSILQICDDFSITCLGGSDNHFVARHLKFSRSNILSIEFKLLLVSTCCDLESRESFEIGDNLKVASLLVVNGDENAFGSSGQRANEVPDNRGKDLDFIGALCEISEDIKNLLAILLSLAMNHELVEDSILVQFVKENFNFSVSLVERSEDFIVGNYILKKDRCRINSQVPSKTKLELGCIIGQRGDEVVVHHLLATLLGISMNVPGSIAVCLSADKNFNSSKSVGLDVNALANVMVNSDLNSLC